MATEGDVGLRDIYSIVDRVFEEGIANEEVLKLYGVWAEDYEKDLIKTEYHGWANTTKAVSAALGDNKDAHILDMACGTGKVGVELAALGFRCIDGIDPNPVMMKYAREKNVYRRIIQNYMGPQKVDEIPDGYYDAACVNAAMGSGHMNSSAFAEMLRVVKKGGYIILQLYDMRLVNAEVKDVRDAIESRIQAGDWKLINRERSLAHKEYGGGDRIGEYITLQVL